MFKKLVYVEVLIVLSILVVLGIFVFGYQDTEITVINQTADDVQVTVLWKDHRLEMGKLSPSAQRHVTLSDEAAVRFVAQYADGHQRESEPLYFSTGISIRVIITDRAIHTDIDLQE